MIDERHVQYATNKTNNDNKKVCVEKGMLKNEVAKVRAFLNVANKKGAN